MDDDLTFGTSVWGGPVDSILSSPPVPSQLRISLSPEPQEEDAFDDFNAFGTPAEIIAPSGDEGDDDFGDFGDFGEVQNDSVPGFGEDATFKEEVRIAGPSSWEPLQLHPMPSRDVLQRQINHILGPLWAYDDTSHLSEEDIRQVEGRNQILVTSESRDSYNLLLPPTPPTFEPVNWTRSRIRRRHLISLGVPVNLDEVLPRASGNLPMLEVTTRPMSAPPGPRTAPALKTLHSTTVQRPGTPQSASRVDTLAAQLRLGTPPDLDDSKINQLLDLPRDSLSLLPIKTLESHLEEIKVQTANTSAMLTYLLQTRDALQQDSDTYNKLIGELVGEAQKIKTGKRVGIRRGSGMV